MGPDRDNHPRAPAAGHAPLPVRRRLGVLAVGIVAFLLFRLLSAFPGVVETVYGAGIGPILTRGLSALTGLVPFSLVEFLLMGYAIWSLVLAGRAVGQVRAGSRTWRHALSGGGLRIARDTGVAITLFYALWGFNYARAPLGERLDWPAWEEPDVNEVARLAAQAVNAANAAYVAIHGSEDAGVPTPMPADLRALDRALETGWARAADLLDLPPSVGRRYAPVKRLASSHLVARFGIAGFYFPWTGEANVLRDTPAVGRPQSMAHEKAHQRGIGPEAEASFLGYVAAALSPDAHARYSAFVFAQGQLLSVLVRADRQRWGEIAAVRLPGIRRDLRDLSEYWEQFRGVGTVVGRTVNDRFLKANRVEGGIASYGRSVRLIITFAAQHDGTVTPGDAPIP